MLKKAGNSYPESVSLEGNTYIPESYEEYVFAEWCATLIRQGYIKSACRPAQLLLNDPMDYTYSNPKGKSLSFPIVSKSAYKGDMIIHWEDKAHGVLFINEGDKCKVNPSPRGGWCKTHFLFYADKNNSSFIDVKGTFTPVNQIPFSRTQQLCASLGYFVQKVVPLGKKGLFMKTFAPLCHLYTPKLGKRRSLFQGYWEWNDNPDTILVDE